VDIFIVLDARYFASDGQTTLLNDVKSALRKTYTKTPISAPMVTLSRSHSLDFKVDVVPGSIERGVDTSYLTTTEPLATDRSEEARRSLV